MGKYLEDPHNQPPQLPPRSTTIFNLLVVMRLWIFFWSSNGVLKEFFDAMNRSSSHSTRSLSVIWTKNRFFSRPSIREFTVKSILKKCQIVSICFRTHRSLSNNTVLEKADFRSAVYYSIDPESNHIAKAKFSLDGLPGLLLRYDLKIEG